jgi:hypothetical protein
MNQVVRSKTLQWSRSTLFGTFVIVSALDHLAQRELLYIRGVWQVHLSCQVPLGRWQIASHLKRGRRPLPFSLPSILPGPAAIVPHAVSRATHAEDNVHRLSHGVPFEAPGAAPLCPDEGRALGRRPGHPHRRPRPRPGRSIGRSLRGMRGRPQALRLVTCLGSSLQFAFLNTSEERRLMLAPFH